MQVSVGLDVWRDRFNSVGWFIPPYIQMGFLSAIAADIGDKGNGFQQADLERILSIAYNPASLSSMVMHRYPLAPVVNAYKQTISESIEAHFLGLDHVATGGLIPVIEGAGRELAAQRSLASGGSIKEVFKSLATDCKNDSARNQIGAPTEVASMMESFITFTETYFYSSSQSYPLLDNTNRHGITHGAYNDTDYGTPINFYKTISAVDFLTFISSFRAHISWLAPSPTPESGRLAAYYEYLKSVRRVKPC
jgi:hypothetical protein